MPSAARARFRPRAVLGGRPRVASVLEIAWVMGICNVAACGDDDADESGTGRVESSTTTTTTGAASTTMASSTVATDTTADSSASEGSTTGATESGTGESGASQDGTDSATGSEDSGESGSDDPEDCHDFEVYCSGRCLVPEFDHEHCGAHGDCLGDNSGERCDPGLECIDGQCARPLEFSVPKLHLSVPKTSSELEWVRLDGGEQLLVMRQSTQERELGHATTGQITSLWASVRSVAGEFEPAQRVTPEAAGDIIDARVVASGELAYLLWLSRLDGDTRIAARRWQVGQGWSETVVVSDVDATQAHLGLTVDAEGNAYASWDIFTGRDWQPRVATWASAGEAWGTALDPGSDDVISDEPQITVDGRGIVTVAWLASSDLVTVWAARFAGAWSSSWPAAQVSPFFAAVSHLAVHGDQSGATTMAWVNQGSFQDLQVQRFEPDASQWSQLTILPQLNPGDRPHSPLIVADDLGHTTVLWSQANAEVPGNHIWAARYDIDRAAWSPAQHIAGRWFGGVDTVAVVDDEGGVMAAWWSTDRERQHAIRGAYFDPVDHSWSSPSLVDDPANGNSFEPALLVEAGRRITALWIQAPTGMQQRQILSARWMVAR